MAAPAPASWSILETETLALDQIEALMAGRLACIRVPGFLEPSWCEEVIRRFHALEPPARRRVDYGETQADQTGLILASPLTDVEEYFNSSAQTARVVRGLYSGGEDPVLKLRRAMEAATGWKTAEPEENGRPYLTDIVWEMVPGARITPHYDIPAPRGTMKIFRYPRFLGWNVYFSEAQSGGVLRLYNRSGRPEEKTWVDNEFRSDCGVFSGAQCVEIRPQPGELILLNVEYYHEVSEISGERTRASCHSQVAVDPAAREMVFWI